MRAGPIAMECFDRVLGERPDQLDRQRDDVASGDDFVEFLTLLAYAMID